MDAPTGMTFTFVTDDRTSHVDASRAGDRVIVAASDLERAIGWRFEAEGLCRGDVCVLVRDRGALEVDGGVDVGAAAAVLRAPFVADAEADVAVLGAPALDRAAERAGMRVDGAMSLRDADGGTHTWSELGRKKKLLFAWASW
jgi:hypothetical protein